MISFWCLKIECFSFGGVSSSIFEIIPTDGKKPSNKVYFDCNSTICLSDVYFYFFDSETEAFDFASNRKFPHWED